MINYVGFALIAIGIITSLLQEMYSYYRCSVKQCTVSSGTFLGNDRCHGVMVRYYENS